MRLRGLTVREDQIRLSQSATRPARADYAARGPLRLSCLVARTRVDWETCSNENRHHRGPVFERCGRLCRFRDVLCGGASLIWLTGSDLRSNVPPGVVSSALVGWFTFRARSGPHRTNE